MPGRPGRWRASSRGRSRRGTARVGVARGSSARSGGATGRGGTACAGRSGSMHVVSPPWVSATSLAARCSVRSGRKPTTSTPSVSGRERGSIRGPVTMTNRRLGHDPSRQRHGVEHPSQQGQSDARAPDRDDAHPLVLVVAESLPQGPDVVGRRVEPRDVAGEVKLALRPLPDRRQPRSEGVGDDVVGVADEDRAVPQPPEPRSLLEHLRVEIRCERGLLVPTVRHRQPTDEVGEPRVAGSLEPRGSRAGSSRRPTPRRR